MQVIVPVTVSTYSIACALCSAFEGGSNYWLGAVKVNRPKPEHEVKHLDSRYEGEAGVFWPLHDSALCEGGSITIQTDDNPKTYILDQGSIERGLQAMAKGSPEHFADLTQDAGDAETGDVFLQYCLFGEVVYG